MERRFDRDPAAGTDAGTGGVAVSDPTRGETARARVSQSNGAPSLGTEAAPMRMLPITADPGPLGLAAFASTTLILSMFNSGLMGKTAEPIVLGMALAVGGLAQLLAGMWEFRTGNTFGAVAFTMYGAFWLSFWAFNQFYASEIKNETVLMHAIGLYLITWGIFTSYMFIASLRVSVAVCAVFALLAATFLLLGIGNANESTNIIKLGGFVGIATAAAAFYASFAAVTNETFARTVLPVKELKR
jgi:succinate-acetate transporter protein